MAQQLGTVYNATPSPIVVDGAGRVIGSREFGVAPVNEQPAKRLLEDGQLVEVTVPDSKLDDEGIAAGARRAARARHTRAGTTPAGRTPAKATTSSSTTTTTPAPAPRPTTEA